jgi:hypothetical protein
MQKDKVNGVFFSMSKAKPKTQAQLDHATDLRLQKAYNRDLKWYNKQLAEQNFGCAVCARPPGTRRLHVDHDHSWKKVKVEADRNCSCDCWHALAVYNGREYKAVEAKKSLAIRGVKRQMLRASVRGLLCYPCNAGLQKFVDNPELLRSAADYLARHQSPDNGQELK